MALDDLAIVLVGAGSSTRMGFDKVWADLGGRPLITHAIEGAVNANAASVVVVVAGERVPSACELVAGLSPADGHARPRVVPGGDRRRDSVAAGLRAAPRTRWVAIHDVARALAPSRLYVEGLAAVQGVAAAVPVLPVKDTIKRVADGWVVETVPRAELRSVQTPQVFELEVLARALASTEEDVTDEAALVERLGLPVAAFPGDERALKLTTPLDFAVARALLGAPA